MLRRRNNCDFQIGHCLALALVRYCWTVRLIDRWTFAVTRAKLPVMVLSNTKSQTFKMHVGITTELAKCWFGQQHSRDPQPYDSSGNSAFVWIPVDEAKKLLSDHPPIKVGGNPVKISLASNFKKWILHIHEFPGSLFVAS